MRNQEIGTEKSRSPVAFFSGLLMFFLLQVGALGLGFYASVSVYMMTNKVLRESNGELPVTDRLAAFPGQLPPFRVYNIVQLVTLCVGTFFLFVTAILWYIGLFVVSLLCFIVNTIFFHLVLDCLFVYYSRDPHSTHIPLTDPLDSDNTVGYSVGEGEE